MSGNWIVPYNKGDTRIVKASTSKASNSTNINYVPTKRGKQKKKAKVDKSFKKAFYKMLPTKEARLNITDLTLQTNGTLAQASVLGVVNDITQGDQLNQRQGASIYIPYVHLRGSLQSNATKTKFFRLMVVRDNNFVAQLFTGTMAGLFKDATWASQAPVYTQQLSRWALNREMVYPYFDKIYKILPEAQNCTIINEKIKIGRTTKYSVVGGAQ